VKMPGFGFLGDVRGVIVEDQLDRGVGRIGGEFQGIDELVDEKAPPERGLVRGALKDGRSERVT
jgi:hypothetical protein